MLVAGNKAVLFFCLMAWLRAWISEWIVSNRVLFIYLFFLYYQDCHSNITEITWGEEAMLEMSDCHVTTGCPIVNK